MRITKGQLRRIIKEEKAKLLNENRQAAFEILDELEMMGVDAKTLLNYLVANWMSGEDAYQALMEFKETEL